MKQPELYSHKARRQIRRRAREAAGTRSQRIEAKTQVVSDFGKEMFWIGLSLLFVVFVGVPFLISLFT